METMQTSTLKAFQAGLGFFLDCNHVALDSHRRLRSLQSSVAAEFEHAIDATSRAVRNASDVPALMAAQNDLWQREAEYSFGYLQQLTELAEANRSAYQKILETAAVNYQSSMNNALESALGQPAVAGLADSTQFLKNLFDWSSNALQATASTQAVATQATARQAAATQVAAAQAAASQAAATQAAATQVAAAEAARPVVVTPQPVVVKETGAKRGKAG